MKKNILISVFLLFTAMACNKSQDNAVPSKDQKVLGMVFQSPDLSKNSDPTALILLKDGRAIKPVSGFNPEVVKAGSKFVFSFQPTAATGSEILNVHVTSFSIASDSLFVPPLSRKDSFKTKEVLTGTFSGIFTYTTVDFSNAADSSISKGPTSLTFNGGNYQSTASASGFPVGGSGTFSVSSTNNYLITFNDKNITPGTNPDLILNGQYNWSAFDDYLIIWKYTNERYSNYLLRK